MLAGSGQLKVSVEDTGIGIPKEKQQSIFSMFGMVQGNQKLNPQGCGLGLSISSMLVQRLGGAEITVQSTPKQGSVFSFTVPIDGMEKKRKSLPTTPTPELEDVPEERVRTESSTTWKAPLIAAGDVLIVDDAPFNRLVVRKILESAGFKCAEASTGLEAIGHISACNDRSTPYAVVIMDVEMPEMDGITATRRMWEMVRQGVLKSLPVIIGCSAYGSEEDHKAALSAGMHFYLEKPVSRTALLDLVSRCCSSATRE